MNTQDETLPALEKHCPNCGQQEIRQLADGFKCHECGKEFNEQFIPYTQAGVLNAKADTQDKSTPRPWRESTIAFVPDYAQIQIGTNSRKVAVTTWELDEQDHANFELIRKAVNRFEALKAVAEAAKFVSKWNLMQISKGKSPFPIQLEKALTEALSALNQIQNAT